MADPRRAQLLREGQEHVRHMRLDEAEVVCRTLLKIAKKDVEVRQLIASIAFFRGDYRTALTNLQKCAATHPRNAGIRVNLGRVRSAQGHYDKALAHFTQALAIDPDYPPAITAKAELLERRGQRDEVRMLLEPLIEQQREEPDQALVFTNLEHSCGNYERAVTIARRHADRPEASGVTRRQLHLTIGRALERLEQHDAAFEAYRAANELGARPFSVRDHQARIDTLISVFSPSGLRAMPRAGTDSSRAVFVLGMPRSGTTLVEQIIDAHPQAHGAGELTALQVLADGLMFRLDSYLPYPGCVEDLTPEKCDELSAEYLAHLTEAAPSATRVVDKYLMNLEHLGLIQLLVPGARVVHCVREPADVCLACYIAGLRPEVYPWAADLRTLGEFYVQYQRLMRHWAEVLDLPIMELKYEALVADQEPVSRALIDFCGLPWDDACLRFHETGRTVMTLSYDQVRRPIYRSAVGRFQHYEKHLGALLEALASGPPP